MQELFHGVNGVLISADRQQGVLAARNVNYPEVPQFLVLSYTRLGFGKVLAMRAREGLEPLPRTYPITAIPHCQSGRRSTDAPPELVDRHS
jgi:hypothetical protein